QLRCEHILRRIIRYYGWFLLQVFVIQGGGIYCVQTQGALYNFHPHIHALVPAGILKNGVFLVKKYPSAQIITQLFRGRLLKVLIKEDVIQEELVELLMSWNHNSGFITGSTRLHIEERRKKRKQKLNSNRSRKWGRKAR
ncbi:MAG: hypothetical protein GY786_01540, partial [Proteobacteria bacterium]|nr:hypothetical protein [Pseudomonadota bacterium]